MDGLRGASEDQLTTLALAGRHDAWEVLIARYNHQVLLSLLARGVRLDVAREVVQETWARLYARHRTEGLPRLALPGLAIKQALFLAIDNARAPAARTVPETEAYRTAADPAPLADERLETREEIERVLRELDRCSPRARELFLAVYNQPGVPHATIAEREQISVQRLRQTLCEVRARLRRALEADGKGGRDAS